jgi:hypothetical protein
VSICSAMRSAAILSGALCVIGLSLLLFAEPFGVVLSAAHAALVVMLGAVLALGIALVLALWPGSRERLTECIH